MARVYSASEALAGRAGALPPVPDRPRRRPAWPTYALSVLGFSLASVLFLYGLQRVQHAPAAVAGLRPGATPHLAWNTAASFVTNTNWQYYSGEATMGHLVQMAGLAVQNFASAAVGMAVAVALVRGFARSRTDRVGNFWVDLVRGCVRILLPAARRRDRAADRRRRGAEPRRPAHGHHPRRRDPAHPRRAGGLPGGDQGARHQRRRLLQRQLRAPVREPQRLHQPARDLPAAAHPVRAAAHVRPDGRRQAPGLRDPRRDGRDLRGARWRCVTAFEAAPLRRRRSRRAGAAMEGKEMRFGVPASALFAAATTLHLDRRGQLHARLVHPARRRRRHRST